MEFFITPWKNKIEKHLLGVNETPLTGSILPFRIQRNLSPPNIKELIWVQILHFSNYLLSQQVINKFSHTTMTSITNTTVNVINKQFRALQANHKITQIWQQLLLAQRKQINIRTNCEKTSFCDKTNIIRKELKTTFNFFHSTVIKANKQRHPKIMIVTN